MKTLALEDIYADPHKLDSYLASGETVELVRGGEPVADFVPHKATITQAVKRPNIDYKARFLKMWGPDAFAGGASVAEEFVELRQGRPL